MIKLETIFPTRRSFIVFNAYMTFFIFQGILIKQSTRDEKQLPYNPALVVLLTECVKSIISLVLCLTKFSFRQLSSEVKTNKLSKHISNNEPLF